MQIKSCFHFLKAPKHKGNEGLRESMTCHRPPIVGVFLCLKANSDDDRIFVGFNIYSHSALKGKHSNLHSLHVKRHLLQKNTFFMIDFTFGPTFFPKRTLLASIWFANFSSRCLNRQFSCGKKSNMSNSGPANFLKSPLTTSSIRILCWHISGIRLATRSGG